MNEPVERYSPVGAVFETWCAWTHQAEAKILFLQALDRETVKLPASSSASGDSGARPLGSLFRSTTDAACARGTVTAGGAHGGRAD